MCRTLEFGAGCRVSGCGVTGGCVPPLGAERLVRWVWLEWLVCLLVWLAAGVVRLAEALPALVLCRPYVSECLFIEFAQGGNFCKQLLFECAIGQGLPQRLCGLQKARAPFCLLQVAARACVGDEQLAQWRGIGNQPFEGVLTQLAHVAVGVVTGRQKNKFDAAPVCRQ